MIFKTKQLTLIESLYILKTTDQELKFLKYFAPLAAVTIISGMIFGFGGIVFIKIIENAIIGWALLSVGILSIVLFSVTLVIGLRITEKVKNDYRSAVDNNDSGVMDTLAPFIASIGLDSDGSSSDSGFDGGDAGGGDD